MHFFSLRRKIKLKFNIKSYYRNKYKEYKYKKSFKNDMTFEQVINSIYYKFSFYKQTEDSIPYNSTSILNDNLFEIDYNFLKFESEPEIYEFKDVILKDLEHDFSISKRTFQLLLNPCTGGDVGRCRGLHFFFHTREKDLHKNTPHIHCKYGKEEIRINLNTLIIMDKPFKNSRNNKLAVEGVKLNQSELLKYWNRTVIKGESVKFKMYLPF